MWGIEGDDEQEGAVELLMGFEPMTSSLPMKCSTTELQQLAVLAKPKRACGEGARQITGTFSGGGGVGRWSVGPGSAARRREGPGEWSGWRESNPRVQLGKLSFYH